MTLRNLKILLRNDSGGTITMGTLGIDPAATAVIWDTLTYDNEAFGNLQQVITGIATFNQNIGNGNLVMVKNTVDQTAAQAFSQFVDLTKAIDIDQTVLTDFEVLRLETSPVTDGVTVNYNVVGLMDVDGYGKLENLDDVAINAHLVDTNDPHNVTVEQLSTSETNTNLVLKPDGYGDVVWGVGGGDVTGPGTHSDNVLPVLEGIDTNVLRTTGITINDSDEIDGVAQLDFAGATATAGDINLPDNGQIYSYGDGYSRRLLKLTGGTLYIGQSTGDSLTSVEFEADSTYIFRLGSTVAQFTPTEVDFSVNVNMNNNNIIMGAGLVDGVDVSSHASRHENTGADEIEISNMGTSETNTSYVLKPDGVGGVTWGFGGGSVDLDGYVVAPGSVIDNGVVRFDGTSGRFIQDGYVTIDDNGNFYLDADGSSIGIPRIFGTINFSEVGESIQWQFGDTANVVQNSYGGSMTLRAYHTIVLRGDNSGTSTSWDTDSNIGVLVDNTATTSPALVVRGASGQSADLQQWRNNGDSVLTNITADGYIELNNRNIQEIRTATFNSVITGSGSGGTINWASGQKQQFTMSGTGTLTFVAPDGPCNLMLKLINGGAYTITWPAAVDWAGGAEPSWTSSGTDIVAFFYDGTTYYGVASLNFS